RQGRPQGTPFAENLRYTDATVGRDVRPGQWASLVTLPDLMQPVQADTRLGAPSTSARTRWMLGFHRRLVRRCEWLTLMPHDGCLPHTSQTAAIGRVTSDRAGEDRGTLIAFPPPAQPR